LKQKGEETNIVEDSNLLERVTNNCLLHKKDNMTNLLIKECVKKI